MPNAEGVSFVDTGHLKNQALDHVTLGHSNMEKNYFNT